jgi:DNA replication protein DnaC
LFELIDTDFNFEHQLIITSNLSALGLIEHWSEQGARYGSSIVTRLVERCNEVNMF